MTASKKSIGDIWGSRSLYVIERRLWDGTWFSTDKTFNNRKEAYHARDCMYRQEKALWPKEINRKNYRVRLYARVEE